MTKSERPINTALCSYGMSGTVFHAPLISQNEGFNLYGAYERSKNNAQKKYPNIVVFRSLEDLLDNDQIELVIVNTPSVTHYEYAKQVIESGRHVVIEKPFTATAVQAEELIALADRNNVVLSVFHNRRYDSDFLTVKSVLDQGVLGPIMDAELHYDRYDPMLSYKAHKEVPTEGVGSLYDLGSHLIDQALQLFGKPHALFTYLDKRRPDSQVVDYFDIKLFYDKHSVTLKSSYYVREPLQGFILHGANGSFLKSRSDVQEDDLKSGKLPIDDQWGRESEKDQGLLHTEINGAVTRTTIETAPGNYMAYYDNIYKAIRANHDVAVSGEEALEVIRIIEKAYQSQKEKRIVTV